MIKRTAHQVTAFALAAAITFGILASIDRLAVQPGEQNLMAAEKAAPHVAASVQGTAAKHAGV